MNKNVMHKDFYMEIRKSLGRFLSIFFIVALGVAFFSGIRSSQPDMLATGDAYFDGARLMDIKAVSTLGITKEDVKAVAEVDGVEKAEGGYSVDALCRDDENQKVLHIMSILPTMNEIAVTKGRLPEKAGECLVDDETEYKVGDVILLESGTDEKLGESLKTDRLEVVGTGSSPCYISFGRGSSAIGTGSISGFVAVTESTFAMDTYTEVYARAKGADKLTAYSTDYENRIKKVIDNIEEITGIRGEIRKKNLVDDALKELDKAKQELADGKKEADEELAKARETIEDGEARINDAKAQIAEGQNQITEAENTLNAKQGELNDARARYNLGRQQFEDGRAAYEQGLSEYNQKKEEYTKQLSDGKTALAGARQELDNNWNNYNQVNGQYQNLVNTITLLEGEIQGLQQEIDSLDAADPDYAQKKAALEAALLEIQTKQQGAQAGIVQIEQQIGAPAGEVLARMKVKLDEGESEYQAKSSELAVSEEQLNSQLSDAFNTLNASKDQLDASEEQLNSAWSQITDGQSQIDSGWSQLKKQKVKLQEAKQQVASEEPKLEEGRQEYEKAKKEADDKIADGETKIRDAEKEIGRIENPKWYVFDRTTLPEYSGYGDNADRMKAIGQVFPVLFFLVAALISLTSMTRMVEEQRMQIGTMKALGYGKAAIASKYLGYAFLATVGGSVFGVLVGEKIIPYIIIYAYGIMYHHMDDILTPYNLYYAGMATGAAVVCTMTATCLSCYNELKAQPAVLMRPPAPKKGKRVFMERITCIWKHLSFIWKSTIRNLFRYKKRFFMTVFGIGGCTALMLVGFGIKDSVFEIAGEQYKHIQVYDGMAYFQEDVSDEERDDLKAFLKKDKDVEAFLDVKMRTVTLTNGSKEWDVYENVPKDTKKIEDFVSFHDRITKEKYRLSDKGVILTEKAAKLLNAKVGDTIQIKDTEYGNKDIAIADICENYMGHYMYISPKLYEEVYGEEPEYNTVFFKVKEEAGDRLEKIGQDILSQEAVMNITYLREIEKQLNDMLKSLNLVIIVLIVSAGMLAFVVLYNLNNINITERKRELATIKVLGFYDPEVSAYVYRENIILTFLGALAGIVMGIVLHRFVIQTVEVDAAMFGRIINFPSYVYSVAFTFGFSFFVNWVMYFKLKKIDMVESLKSVE